MHTVIKRTDGRTQTHVTATSKGRCITKNLVTFWKAKTLGDHNWCSYNICWIRYQLLYSICYFCLPSRGLDGNYIHHIQNGMFSGLGNLVILWVCTFFSFWSLSRRLWTSWSIQGLDTVTNCNFFHLLFYIKFNKIFKIPMIVLNEQSQKKILNNYSLFAPF